MRLINPQRTGQQSMGRNDSSVTAEAGEASAVRTVTEGVSDTMTSLSGASEQILETNTRRQKQQSELYMQKVENEFWEDKGGRDFFDVSEIPEHLVTEGMMMKGRVASAEVIPQMYADHIKESLPNASKIIENDNMRSEWFAGAEKIALGRQQNVQTSANATIEKQIFIDQKMNYDNYMDIDRPDMALRVAQEMTPRAGMDKIVEDLQDGARKGAETVRYKTYMLEGDLEGVFRSIEFLETGAGGSLDNDLYQEQYGQLNDTERLAWLNKLKIYVKGLKAGNTAKSKANARMLKREVKMVRKNSDDGSASDADADLELLSRVQIYNANNEDELNVQEADLILDIGFHGVNDTMLLMNAADRDKFAKDEKLKVPGFEKDSLNERLKKSNDAFTKKLNTNAMRAAEDAGFFGEEGLVQIDWNSSPEDLASALSKRYDQFNQMQANYGESIGDGIFDNDNVPSYSALIDGKTTMEKVAIFSTINKEFGRQSDGIYKQLGIEGNAKAFAVAGSIAVDNPSMSEMIMIGEEYARTPQRDLSSLRTALMPKISEYVGNAYGRDFKWGEANMEAAYYGYIGMAKDSTDLTTVDSAKGHLWFDKGIFEKVMESTTGGIVSYGDVKFVSPAPGVDSDTIETWAEGLSMDWLAKEGLNHKDSVNISKGLATKNLSLVPVDKGTFYLMDKNGYYMGDGKGGTFKLRYDPEMPIEYKGDFLSREQTDITKEYYGN